MHQNVRVYLDDIPMFSKSREEHTETLRRVIQILIDHRLFAKAKKCEFYLPEIDLLGVKVSAQGFRMEEKKVMEVQEWRPPRNVRGVREFLGFINFYRQFIKDFAKIARPLHDLTKKDQGWAWTDKEETAFTTLKKLVTSELVLRHADQTREFRMETDVSNYAYGAVLSQKQDTGRRHPVAYMSKSMTPAERNYDIGDKETLVIVKPLQHWQHWLEGTRLPIEIITDHKNLENFSNPRILNQRQTRWLHALQKYNFVIGYRPSQQNSAADALSRRPELKQELDKIEKTGTLFPKEKFVELDLIAADSKTSAFLDAIATDQEIMEQILRNTMTPAQYDEGRIVVPADDKIRRALLQLYHDSPMAGHQGITGTYELLGRMYTWPKMKEYVEAYVKGCATCAKAKKRHTREQGKMQPLPNPETPWNWTESDLIGPLPRSKGKDSIYVVVDRFTKYAYFVPCNTTETAQSLAQLHAKHVWAHEGLPRIHSSDRGPQFRAEYTKELYKKLGIEQRLSTAYHPQSQGQVENLNGWLETYLRMFIGHRQDDWVDHLHTAQFAWNNHYHNSIGTTPFFASRIRHPQMTDLPPKTQDIRT